MIAKVQGVATAAGCQLVAACDLAVAADAARFATPGVSIGLSAPRRWCRSTAPSSATRSRCSSPATPIERADRAGVGVVEPGSSPSTELDAAVDALVGRSGASSPRVIGLGKRAFYDQIERAEPDTYERVRPVMAANAADGDAQDIAAFLEKRPPEWPAR